MAPLSVRRDPAARHFRTSISVPRTPEFVDLVLENLKAFGAVTTRRMFGGWGIYRDGVFFALIAQDTLYFKSDEENRAQFERESPGPFVFEKKGERIVT